MFARCPAARPLAASPLNNSGKAVALNKASAGQGHLLCLQDPLSAALENQLGLVRIRSTSVHNAASARAAGDDGFLAITGKRVAAMSSMAAA